MDRDDPLLSRILTDCSTNTAGSVGSRVNLAEIASPSMMRKLRMTSELAI